MADRSSLARATDSSNSPTPGYLYSDIANSVASSPVACSETMHYLRRRLIQHKNPNIKHKCLKVMGMVAASPVTRGSLKREIVKETSAVSAIKECLSFTGPMDPIHGDAMFQKVRDAAKECLDIIYSDEPSSVDYNATDPGGHSSSGHSQNNNNNNNNNSGAYPLSQGGGRKKMEGIGNPMFKNSRMDETSVKGIGQMTIGEVVSTAKEGFKGMINDPFAKNIPNANNNPPRYSGPSNSNYGNNNSSSNSSSYGKSPYGNQSSYSNTAPPGQRELVKATDGEWTMASNRGPNAYRPNMAPVSTTGVGGSWASSSAAPSFNQQNEGSMGMTQQSNNNSNNSGYNSNATAGNTNAGGGRAVSDGSFEKNLVAELCPPGGMKAVPPPDKLNAFQNAIPSLDADLVCPALLDCLEDGQPWIIRAKALCVMEVCCSVPAYADFFHACAAEIEPLVQHPRSAVREPAKRLMNALGMTITIATTTDPISKPALPHTTPPSPPADLLDFGASNPMPPTHAPPAPPPALPPPTSPPPALPVSVPSSDMFGGMNVKSQTTTVTTTSTTEVAPTDTTVPAAMNTNDNSNISDLLGNVKQPAAGDMFGDMTLKQATSTETVSSSTNASSAFSFMNAATVTSDNNTDTTTATQKPSFDPLLDSSNTNVSNRQPMPAAGGMTPQALQQMSMNPQMQAAFFQQQQQLMMMQMQMQQMQMTSSTNTNTANPHMLVGNGKHQVMGGSVGGVTTSFAFMDDPAKVRKEKQNKTFDFVKDAMKGAK